jgi:hypothetical protein
MELAAADYCRAQARAAFRELLKAPGPQAFWFGEDYRERKAAEMLRWKRAERSLRG